MCIYDGRDLSIHLVNFLVFGFGGRVYAKHGKVLNPKGKATA